MVIQVQSVNFLEIENVLLYIKNGLRPREKDMIRGRAMFGSRS
jgi:hypothetical protein